MLSLFFLSFFFAPFLRSSLFSGDPTGRRPEEEEDRAKKLQRLTRELRSLVLSERCGVPIFFLIPSTVWCASFLRMCVWYVHVCACTALFLSLFVCPFVSILCLRVCAFSLSLSFCAHCVCLASCPHFTALVGDECALWLGGAAIPSERTWSVACWFWPGCTSRCSSKRGRPRCALVIHVPTTFVLCAPPSEDRPCPITGRRWSTPSCCRWRTSDPLRCGSLAWQSLGSWAAFA